MAEHSVPASELQARLVRGAAEMNMPLSDEQVENLMAFLQLFIKWNKAYNLTSIRDPREMVPLHLLDSLAVNPFISDANNLIDVGTGPGWPGMVLAIINPDKQFTLLDSNGKKTRFMFQAKAALGLSNVTIINGRVEAYHPPEPFDMIVSRAFASLQDMVSWCRHLPAADGCFLAMKGLYPEDELQALPADIQLVESNRIEVPGVDGQRHVLRLIAANQ